MPIPFGVQAETGQYLPPIQESDLDHIQKASQLAEIRAANANASHLAAIAEVAPDNLEQTGWGVIFASATPAADKQAIKDALKPLLDLRASQAGDLFKIFDDANGYQQGVSADQWLSARGSALNVVDPTQGVPYYLLIVGSPAEIPFEFQYDLDTYFAVGRLPSIRQRSMRNTRKISSLSRRPAPSKRRLRSSTRAMMAIGRQRCCTIRSR